MKVKTKDLIDTALHFAVVKCLNPDWNDEDLVAKVTAFDEFDGTLWNFSTDWSQGGPIIEREDINVIRFTHSVITESGDEIYRKEGWMAFTTTSSYWMTPKRTYGPTPLIAAMRCYVASNLGDEVDIPGELT